MKHDRQLIHLEQVPSPCFFSKNSFNEDFIRRNTHRPTTTTEANDNAAPTSPATTPYINGIFENISRILQSFNIRVECGEKNRLCRSISKALKYPWFFFHEVHNFPQALPMLVVTHFLMTIFMHIFAPDGGYRLFIS